MLDGAQRHEHTRPEPQRADDRKLVAAHLELGLQRDPNQAQQWCRLGELYDALASDAAAPEVARTYREKAVAALMRAISLSPGMGKAHYALANVYRAQDMRLALVEFEAAADCDPQQYAEPLAHAREVAKACTYRVGELKLIVLGSALEKPRAEILEAEFYFEGHPIASAVLHTCASEGGRQTATFWLLETENPDLTKDRPVAQLTTTSTGNVFLSNGYSGPAIETPVMTSGGPREPILVASRDAAPQQGPSWRSVIARAAAPLLARKSRSSVWIPGALILVAVGGALFAYRTLFAPPDPSERAAASSERQHAPSIHAATDPIPEVVALKPEPVPPARADNPVPIPPQSSSLPSEPPARADRAAPVRREPVSPTRPRPSAAQAVKARPAQSPTGREQAIASRARQEQSLPRPADAPIGTASTEAPTAEMKRYLSEPLATAPAVRKEQEVPVPSTWNRSAAESSWLQRMRAELTSCGRPGLFRADLCREAVRWNYCFPNRWDTVRECAVQRFASSGTSD